MWSVHPNIFIMTFYANHSVWLVLFSKFLVFKCLKWIKSTLCCDCYTKIIYSFTVLNCGRKRLVSPAVLRMPEPWMWSMYAKITFWRQTSQRVKGNDWTEGQCHVVQTWLHKSQHHSFLIPHSRKSQDREHRGVLWKGLMICQGLECQKKKKKFFFVNLYYPTSIEMCALCNCILL